MAVKYPLDKFNEVQTPFYYYDIELLEDTLNNINDCTKGLPFYVHYAVKANANDHILRTINTAGLGIDCVSGGEVAAAINAGFDSKKIVFAGVGKTDREISLALDANILCFNVESIPELEAINELAQQKGKIADVAFRINPNVDAHTHKYITTGLSENKFGINLEQLPDVLKLASTLKNINVVGLHFHIGSQITILEPFKVLCDKINALQKEVNEMGFKLKIINVGGGLGVDYENPDKNPIPDFKSYFDIFKNNLILQEGQEVHFELGRAIVAQCGSLITQVTYVKKGTAKQFVITDAGMTDLIRPALYQAHHNIENITATTETTEIYDVVGPICESSDCFGENETLPTTKRGDLLALRTAGAYGEIMASRYNLRDLPTAVYSK
ncbi:MAG: diaminopimelate decarboxylase [Muribaculaceae bacterium]|jgi:diaminopimelate decarboxylase|nr:diaminopimelate decarboxylase [Muribaculaceae bacterium]MEE1337337.1 diaminopimelate decarboxylase [Muribaculaceae bacterium]